MNKLEEVLNIPHFKDDTLRKIENLRKNKISFSFTLPNFINKQNNHTYVPTQIRAENYLSINLAKYCSTAYSHEEVLKWKEDSFFFDFFKIFDHKPLFINDEKINIKINFYDLELSFVGNARFNDLTETFLIGDQKSSICKMAEKFINNSTEKFYVEIQLENSESLIPILKLDDGIFWENIFLKDLKFENLPETIENLSKETKEYLDQYNRCKELDLFYQIKLSLNAKSL